MRMSMHVIISLIPIPIGMCNPLCRFISSFGEDKFTAMDVNRTDVVDIVLVRSFVKAMSPTAGDAQVSWCGRSWATNGIGRSLGLFTISMNMSCIARMLVRDFVEAESSAAGDAQVCC